MKNFALVLALLFVRVAAATDAPPAADLAATVEACAGCHGLAGVSKQPATPHLNGQMPAYLADSIERLAKGGRPTAVPKHIPASLTAAQIAAIVNLYSTSQEQREKESVDPELLPRGREVYIDRCMNCHADNGRASDGYGLEVPLLAGQRVAYLMAQTRAFRSGKRKFTVSMMHGAFTGTPTVVGGFAARDGHDGLSDADLEAVSHYFAAVTPAPPPKVRRRSASK